MSPKWGLSPLAVTYNNRGYAYISKRDYDQVISDFTKALVINPKLAIAYIDRGVVFIEGDSPQNGDRENK